MLNNLPNLGVGLMTQRTKQITITVGLLALLFFLIRLAWEIYQVPTFHEDPS